MKIKRITILSLFLVIICIMFAECKIYIKSMPLRLIRADDIMIADNTERLQKIGLEWVGDNYGPPPQNCQIFYRTSPGMEVSDYNLGPIPQSSQGKLVNFRPVYNGMTGGVYYCIVVEQGNPSNRSDEFVLYIESLNTPQLLEPQPYSKITNTTPRFSWTRVTGVPYYFIMVTDQKIILDYDPQTMQYTIRTQDGLPVIPVWEAITSENNLVYGTPDPSGFFKGNPEPLLGNTTYTWVVLNCYGNNPSFISGVITASNEFTVIKNVNLPKATLVTPFNDPINSISGDIINFTWLDNWNPMYSAIANFHIYTYKEALSGAAVDIAVLIDDAYTSNKYYDLNAAMSLSNSKYYWRVITEDSQSNGIKSATWVFKYEKPSGTLKINTQYYNPATTNNEYLPFTNIEITAVSGGNTNPFPFVTDSSGTLSCDFSPGTYKITATKESFQPVTVNAVVTENNITNLTVVLKKNPCFIVGTVLDELNAPVNDAKIKAITASPPYEEKIAYSDSNGIFRLTVSTGISLNISATKINYSSSNLVNLTVPEYPVTLNAGNLYLERNKNIITGNVLNENGYSITNAEVKVTLGSIELKTLTDSNGYYNFNVGNGIWILTARKTGFTSPLPVNVSVNNGETAIRNLILTSQANRVTGNVTDNQQNIYNATVIAITLSGQVIDTDYTDIYGQYSVNLPAGNTYEISASKSGYTSGPSQQITFSPYDSGITISGINFTLTPNTSYITGRITIDGTTGLEGALISNGTQNTYSNPDGTYTLSVIMGNHRITATKTGYTPTPSYRDVTIGPGQTLTNIDFTLTPNASVIEGTVYSTQGEKIYQATVIASTYPGGAGSFSTQTDINGFYNISLNAGTWYIKAKKSKFLDSSWVSVTVAPGQTSSFNDLYITPNFGYLTGTVKSSGTLVRDAVVKIYHQGIFKESTVTNIYGQFTLALEPQNYSITVEKTGYQTYTSTGTYSVAVGLTTNTGNIELEKTVYYIDGYVNGPAGPLKDVTVSANQFTKLTDNIGYYKFSLNSGTYNVYARKTGYICITATQTITFTDGIDPEGTTKSANFTMNYNYGVLKGTVTTSGIIPLRGAIINANGQITCANTSGIYSIVLAPGDYTVTASSQGYTDMTINTTILEGTTKYQNFNLTQAIFKVSGTVKTSTGAPVSVVTVQLNKGTISKTAISNQTGNFTIEGLESGTYNVTVLKTGYSLISGSSTITLIDKDISGIEFILEENNAFIDVTATDSETQQGLSSVNVYAEGETPQTSGFTGQTITGSDGKGRISCLKSGLYSLKAEKEGYKTKVSTGNNTGVTVNLTLLRNYGSISGTVTKNSIGISSVTVKAVSISGKFPTRTTTTGSNGNYTISNIFPDIYDVSVNLTGHYPEPFSRQVEISASSYSASNITNINFTVYHATITVFELTSPAEDMISNINQKYQFSLLAKDNMGRVITYWEPIWRISPIYSGSISNTGLYTPRNNFLGRVEISAEISGRTVATQKPVYYKIYQSSSDVTVQGTEGLKLIIPKNVTKDPNFNDDKITLLTKDVESSRLVSETYSVCSKVYDLKPDSFKFTDNIKIQIFTPKIYPNVSIGTWDKKLLKWIPLQTEIASEYAQADINHFSEYALLINSTELGISEPIITPNPFSPKIRPLSISYYPMSNSGSFVFVTIKIYNIVGDLVKTLKKNNSEKRGELQEVFWDGTNDNGEMCLNGRYIIHFMLEDASGKVNLVKQVVLIK